MLNSLWLNNTLHFGLRSRNDHCDLLWGDIQFKTDEDGVEYLEGMSRCKQPSQIRVFASGKLYLLS